MLAACVLAACGRGRKDAAPQPLRPFPVLKIPAMMTESQERTDYEVEHYWDNYFAGGGRTDSEAVLGVPTGDVEQALANYIDLLDQTALPKAQKGVRNLFKGIEAAQRADTASHVYTILTEMVANYLYDPNSPLRSEDYYLPFVKGMAASEFTPSALRAAFNYQAALCSLNPGGGVAADFTAELPDGGRFTLHGIRAGNILLFFSNPGCHACVEIIAALEALDMDALIADGKLAVVNMYIDEDVDAWREYVGNYPENWYNARDPYNIIRNDELYNVRAIPSLYLLDAGKRVIFKDATPQKIINFLEKI